MILQQRIRTGTLGISHSSLPVSLGISAAAEAAAPMVKRQAPGYYRMMLGDFEVTAISDGTVDLPMTKLLTRTTPADTKRAYERAFLKDPVETSVNAYLSIPARSSC